MAALSITGKVTWMHGAPSEPMASVLPQIIEGFRKKYPQSEPSLELASGNYQEKLRTMVAGGTPPEVFVGGDVWALPFDSFTLDLRPYIKRDAKVIEVDDFYPELTAASQIGGKFFGFARYFNLSLLYHNKKLFEGSAVASPTATWTWDAYMDAARKTTKREAATPQWGATVVTGWWGEWLIYVRQAGGDMFDNNDRPTKCTLHTPEALAGLQMYYDKVYKHQVAPPPGGAALPGGFAGGGFALEYGGHTGNWPKYRQSTDLSWDVTILPSGPKRRNGGELAIDALSVVQGSKNPDGAWEFVKYATSKEGIRIWTGAGLVPVRKSIADELWFKTAKAQRPAPQNLEAIAEGIKYAMPVPRHVNFQQLALQTIQPEIDLMLQNKQGPGDAGKAATENANRVLASG